MMAPLLGMACNSAYILNEWKADKGVMPWMPMSIP
jgi:hypothetical protein